MDQSKGINRVKEIFHMAKKTVKASPAPASKWYDNPLAEPWLAWTWIAVAAIAFVTAVYKTGCSCKPDCCKKPVAKAKH